VISGLLGPWKELEDMSAITDRVRSGAVENELNDEEAAPRS